MKKILLLIALSSFQFVNAQTKDAIYLEAEVLPEYPGGEDAMMKFISKNLNYPVKERENGISGRVIVGFAVMNDGRIDSIKILTNTPVSFNNEVIRVLKLMPNWKPAVQSGKPVNAYFTLPVEFQLADNSEPAKPKSRDLANIAGYLSIISCVVAFAFLYQWLF
jgi:TonB family protein